MVEGPVQAVDRRVDSTTAEPTVGLVRHPLRCPRTGGRMLSGGRGDHPPEHGLDDDWPARPDVLGPVSPPALGSLLRDVHLPHLPPRGRVVSPPERLTDQVRVVHPGLMGPVGDLLARPAAAASRGAGHCHCGLPQLHRPGARPAVLAPDAARASAPARSRGLLIHRGAVPDLPPVG
eukprot:15002694-Heterocapsa_arctica.AAC.1